MEAIRRFADRVRALVFSLWKRSLADHASVQVTNLEGSILFYRGLGFRRVTSSKNDEVVLLRNHQRAELNLVRHQQANDAPFRSRSVSIEVTGLERLLNQIGKQHPGVTIEKDATSTRVVISDPDGNSIEFYELIDRKRRPPERIYHVATESEISNGLSEHYYMPPMEERRFLHCPERSSIAELVLNRVAAETGERPILLGPVHTNFRGAQDAIFFRIEAERAWRSLATRANDNEESGKNGPCPKGCTQNRAQRCCSSLIYSE